MLWCIQYRKRLGAYLDGELSRRKSIAVENHLKRCTSCRAALEEIRGLGTALRSFDVSPPPTDMVFRIMSEARERKSAHARQKTGDSLWDLFLQPAWTFRAATVSVMILGITVGSFMGWSTAEVGTESKNKGTSVYEGYLLESFGSAPAGSLESGALALLGEERR